MDHLILIWTHTHLPLDSGIQDKKKATAIFEMLILNYY